MKVRASGRNALSFQLVRIAATRHDSPASQSTQATFCILFILLPPSLFPFDFFFLVSPVVSLLYEKMRPKIGAFCRGLCRIYRFVPCSFLSVQNCYCRRRTRPDPASVTVPFCIAILPFTMTRSMPDGALNGCR